MGDIFWIDTGTALGGYPAFRGVIIPDEDRIVQDDQMHEKLQMVVLSIHRAISDDGRFKQGASLSGTH